MIGMVVHCKSDLLSSPPAKGENGRVFTVRWELANFVNRKTGIVDELLEASQAYLLISAGWHLNDRH
jgi:hypothetical protein